MYRAMKPHPHHLRHATGVVAVRLVDLRFQHHSPRTEQPLRRRSSFQSNSLEAVGSVPQYPQQGSGFARHLRFSYDLARAIHNADARVLDRHVQARKMVHAALLLLMLEAASTDLVSPSA